MRKLCKNDLILNGLHGQLKIGEVHVPLSEKKASGPHIFPILVGIDVPEGFRLYKPMCKDPNQINNAYEIMGKGVP